MQRGHLKVEHHPVDQRLRPRHEPQPDPGAQHLGQGVEPHHPPLRVEGEEAGHPLFAELHVVVGVVLEDEHVVLAREAVDGALAGEGEDGARGVGARGVEVHELGEAGGALGE